MIRFDLDISELLYLNNKPSFFFFSIFLSTFFTIGNGFLCCLNPFCMKWFKAFLGVIVLVGLLISLQTKFGSIPPLGSFFDPFDGFWANAEDVSTPNSFFIQSDALQDSVFVYFDDREVPHIQARNESDMFFAQGYVTARHRLWQMEFQTLAAAGRLSEVLGEATLEYDRFQRRFGMVYGAKRSLAEMENDATAKQIAESYAAGINAYIQSLSEAEYPLEYKLLDYRPEPWTPLKTALLLKYMSYMLTGNNSELAMTNTWFHLGEKDFRTLFNEYVDEMQPYIPDDEMSSSFTHKPLTPLPVYKPDFIGKDLSQQPDKGNGSNNWAVSGTRTKTGYPILANDPHLTMSLPSIWYEIELSSPGYQVYGASLPGAPAVVIGFNKNVAWGVTNTGADVLDAYAIEFNKEKTQYVYNGEWKPLQIQMDTIFVRNSPPLIDTTYFTHHGPVVYEHGQEKFNTSIAGGYAYRWTAHDGGKELLTLYGLNKAQNYNDFIQALHYFQNPAQNFAFADVQGNIALWSNGKFPRKWKDQGRFLSDGSKPDYEWQGWVPHADYPHVKNPKRGFVSSSNQFPINPDKYPYYLDADFAEYERGARVNNVLSKLTQVTAQDMLALQGDNLSLWAQSTLPAMLDSLPQTTLTDLERQAFSILQDWNFVNDADDAAPTIFNTWFAKLRGAIWQDEFPSDDKFLWPNRTITSHILTSKLEGSRWIDDRSTPEKESLSDLLEKTFSESIQELQNQYGAIGRDWLWGNHQGAQINHILRLPAFSRKKFTGGGRESVNAIRGSHGPSWRMIVQLGETPQAFGVYPGGQSGNPGSPHYADFLDHWAENTPYRLRVFGFNPDSTHSFAYKIEMGGSN